LFLCSSMRETKDLSSQILFAIFWGALFFATRTNPFFASRIKNRSGITNPFILPSTLSTRPSTETTQVAAFRTVSSKNAARFLRLVVSKRTRSFCWTTSKTRCS
jgi:hypothetical protein